MTSARTPLLRTSTRLASTPLASTPLASIPPASTRLALALLATALLGLAAGPSLAQQPTLTDPNPPAANISLAQLRSGFLHPPDSAKPIVRWWWFGPAVVKPEILHELQQMKADGIGGAELAFVYPEVLDDPAKDLRNLPFLSPPMLDAVRYAQTEGRRLGLRIDITLCSGWPYGGPNTPLPEASTRLRTVEVPIPPGQSYSWSTPSLAPGESLLAMAVVQGSPKHWNPATAFMPANLATGVDAGPYPEPHVALYFIQSHTRQQVKRAAVGAEGYVLDPFSHAAVAHHLASVGEPLLSAFGSTPPYSIFSDSLEAYGADWTPDLPRQFLQRRGYDLLQHLPELVAGGSPAADKIRHDYGLTLTELVNENYLAQINAWALAHHTRFRSQTYGTPAVSFSSQSIPGLAEGEGPQWRAFSTLRWASSANHVFHHAVTSGETFTWLHSPVFRAIPLDMKAEADIDFLSGENQLVFHGWPYSPPTLPDGTPEVPEPGWSLYAAAALNDHNPWHPVMPAVTSYITRLSWLLRQGQPANQVALLLPTDDAWATFAPGHVSLTDAFKTLLPPELISTILSAGYNIDFIDADAIDHVGLGSHQILIIPPTTRIPVKTLQKLRPWYKNPGQVICYQRCPSLDPDGQPLPGLTGSFLLADTPAALTQDMLAAAPPDLTLRSLPTGTVLPQHSVGYIHRRLADADVFFLANTGNTSVDIDRVDFNTPHHFGRQFAPDTSSTSLAARANGPLHLAPYESRVFIFADRDPDPAARPSRPWMTGQLADLTTDWRLRFTALNKSIAEPTLTDWTADPATLHYSGEGVYTRDFTLATLPTSPAYLVVNGGHALPGAPNSTPEPTPDGQPNPLVTRPGPGMHAWFDPPIRAAALVLINGKPAGALWHPPYRLDVTQLLHTGTNHIEIHVYNTALNAWSALPPHDYKPLIAKYGDRFQMQDLDRVQPIPSGILGTIQLITEQPQ